LSFFSRNALLIPLLATIVLAACGSGDSDNDGGSPTPTSTPEDVTAIRGVDLASVPEVETALRQFGGELDDDSVLYTDLTDDGREDAVVPIASGGTLGNLAFLVLTLKDDQPLVILTRAADGEGGVAVEIEGGQLAATTAEYGPEDPLCCPRYLKKTYYRWDGAALQVDREDRFDNPDAQDKD
jgi:hypothetical protein